MRNGKVIMELVQDARQNIETACNKFKERQVIDFGKDVAVVSEQIGDMLQSVANIIAGEGTKLDAEFPEFLKSFKYTEVDGRMEFINLTVRSKLNAELVHKETKKINCDENFVNEVVNTVVETALVLFVKNLALENIKEFRLELARMLAEDNVQIPFDFDFVLEDDLIVTSITDEEVVLGICTSDAFNLGSLAIFQGGDAYSENIARTARDTFFNSLKVVQTPVQLLKAKIQLLLDITGLNTKERADSILRKTYHKQAKYFGNTKVGIGYVSDKVEINGEEVQIFALVKKDGDEKRVILSPFDVKTLESVDVDVLALVDAEAENK